MRVYGLLIYQQLHAAEVFRNIRTHRQVVAPNIRPVQ